MPDYTKADLDTALQSGWIDQAKYDRKLSALTTAQPKIEESSSPTISPVESYTTGASVGGSLGLTRPVLSLAGMASGLTPKEAWQKSGEFIQEAKGQNPKSYTGGLVTSILAPSGGFGAVSKGVGTALKATGAVRPALATLGGTTLASGVQAGGQAIAENKEDTAANEILQAMAANAGASAVGTGISKTASLLKSGGKRMISSLQNISRDAIETYEKNPKVVNTLIADKLQTFVPEVADDIGSKIQSLGTKLEGDLTNVVSKHSKVIDAAPIISEVEKQYNNLSKLGMTPDKRRAANEVYQTWTRLQNRLETGQSLTASDLLELKRDFQRAAESVYEGQSTGPVQEAFASIAEKATQALKDQVKGTGKILASQKEAIEAKNALGLTGEPDIAKLKNLLSSLFNPDKVQKGIPKIVEKFDQIYGTELGKASQLFRSAAQLGKEDIISGYGTGRAFVGPFLPVLGGAVGGLAGALGSEDRSRGGLTGGSIGSLTGLAGMIAQSPGTARYGITGLKGLQYAGEKVGEAVPSIVRSIQASRNSRLRNISKTGPQTPAGKVTP